MALLRDLKHRIEAPADAQCCLIDSLLVPSCRWRAADGLVGAGWRPGDQVKRSPLQWVPAGAGQEWRWSAGATAATAWPCRRSLCFTALPCAAASPSQAAAAVCHPRAAERAGEGRGGAAVAVGRVPRPAPGRPGGRQRRDDRPAGHLRHEGAHAPLRDGPPHPAGPPAHHGARPLWVGGREAIGRATQPACQSQPAFRCLVGCRACRLLG